MKLKSLTHFKGESAVKAILERRLARTPFQVWGKVRLNSVIGKEPNESLPRDLFDYLTRAELDYLILHRDPPNFPLLGVEFDGPHHEIDSEARKRDLLKNRLCRMARLPLLRVRYQEIEPLFTHDTFLSYIIEVVLRYKRAHEKKEYAIPHRQDAFTERDYDEISRHDLPDIQRLRDQLATKHRMIPSDRICQVPNAEFAFEFNLGGSDYASSETDHVHEGHLVVFRVDRFATAKEWPEVHRIAKVLSLRTHYRTTEEPRPPWPKDSFDLPAMEAYVRWLETEPWYFPDIPGVNWIYVAWNLLEALCLKQLLADADGGKLPA